VPERSVVRSTRLSPNVVTLGCVSLLTAVSSAMIQASSDPSIGINMCLNIALTHLAGIACLHIARYPSA